MYTELYRTKEFDDIQKAAQEIIEAAGQHSSKAVGFLICDSMVDSDTLNHAISEGLPFPIIGGTTLTFPFFSSKDQELAALLLVFEKPGVCFSIAVSPPLSETDSVAQMHQTYQECISGLVQEPKLLIPFFPLMPGIMVDRFIHDLFKLAGNLPVFGGITTNDLVQTTVAVFANGKSYRREMVLLALSGDIQPVFAVGSQVTCMAEYTPTISASDGNIVSRVDDMSFCDYLSRLGVPPENRINGVDAMLQYGPLPVLLQDKLEQDDGISEIRCISHTNVEKGSVAFSSNIPEGTKVSVSILNKQDVEESAQFCLNALLGKIENQEKQGYTFSTLLCVSCVARYFALVGDENVERTLLNRKIPSTLSAISYYGFSEIAPTGTEGTTLQNRSHNASIIMCAF